MHKIKHVLAVLFTCWVSAAANAAVIQYDESASGDLTNPSCPPSCVEPTSVGTLGIGTNTITGTAFVSSGADTFIDAADFDGFSFTIPAGASLEEISYAFSVSTTGAIVDASTSYSLHDDLVVGMSFETVNFFTAVSPVSMFGGGLPLGSGDYFIRQGGGAMVCSPFPCRWDLDYTWSLLVTGTVPEPATLALLGIGLAGFAFRRRKTLVAKRA